MSLNFKGTLSFTAVIVAILCLTSTCKTSSSKLKDSNDDTVGGNNIDVGPDTVGGNNADPNDRSKQVMPFHGENDVNYCLRFGKDVNQNSGETRPEVLKEIVDAELKRWVQYTIDHDISSRLVNQSGKPLPKKFSYNPNCSDQTIIFYFGSEVTGEETMVAKMDARDSTLSAIFARKDAAVYRPYLWFAGPAKMDYTDRPFLAASVRHLIGRLYGNSLVSGTILERFPEDLYSCYKEGNEECTQLIKNQSIDGFVSLASGYANHSGEIIGCSEDKPTKLIYLKSGFKLMEGDSVFATINWKNPPSIANSTKEVFMQWPEPILFHDTSTLSGFDTLGEYFKLELNQGRFRAVVSVKKGGKFQTRYSITECP